MLQRGSSRAVTRCYHTALTKIETHVGGILRRIHRLDEARFGLIMLAPTVLLFVVLIGLPIIYAFVLSIHKIELTVSPGWKFTGLMNYLRVITDRQVIASAPRTLYFAAIMVSFTTCLALLLALVLNEQFSGQKTVRALVLMPWAVAPVVSGVMWKYMFHQKYGLINAGLVYLGVIDNYILWFDDPLIALTIAAFASIWKALPFATIIILAALQSVPESLYRAAKMDGALMWDRFRHVTAPHIRGIMIFVVILQIISALQAFDMIYTLTRGGPGQATVMLNFLTWVNAFERLSIGMAASMAITLAFVIMLLSAVANNFRKKIRD